MRANRGCDLSQRVARAFHHIRPTSAVDMDIDESRRGNFIFGNNFLGADGHNDVVARSDRLDYAVAKENRGVPNFTIGSKRAANMQAGCSHGRYSS